MLSPFSHCFFIVFLFFLSLSVEGRPTVKRESSLESSPLVPALYVFGDSLVENGNNNKLLTVANADYTPYGIDFPGGNTGRFSNGRTMADMLSEKFGLPYSPPYLGKPQGKWLTGYNYASAASGFLDNSGYLLGQIINFDNQLSNFKDTIDNKLSKYFSNKTDLSHHLATSVYLIAAGNNDYLINYLNMFYPKYKLYNAEQFVDVVINRITQLMKRLYGFGARKVIIVELSPIGAIPLSRLVSVLPRETQNRMAAIFNAKLRRVSTQLTSNYKGSKFIVAKIHDTVQALVNNPSKFGFTDCHNSCCLSLGKCLPGVPPCRDRNKYCFYDAFHPTEAMTNFVVNKCFADKTGSICNITEILHA